MSDRQKQQEIEAARTMLYNLVNDKNGDLSDPEVAKLSAYLDELIVAYEKTRN